MENTAQIVKQRVQEWLSGNFDEETKKQVKELSDNNPAELEDSFYTNLEFGTGGMRGIMGVGTNRMNIYTIGMATQGLSNYLLKMFPNQQISVAIAHDCRNNSVLFSNTAADVFSANGIKVYLFDGMRPTPELSFAIRYLKCQSGVVLTASHNPKNYNGYKVYWDDGAQIVEPHDKNVVGEVVKITNINEVKFKGDPSLIKTVGAEVDEEFLKISKSQLFQPGITGKEKISIVYTPLHGTGGVLVPRALKECGFTNVHLVEEQMVEDGNFPTVKSPNPEEPSALKMALEYAARVDADIILATDPDADRVGIAIKNKQNEYVLLNGNQTGALMVKYILEQWKQHNGFKGNEFTVSTIVTSALIKDISAGYGVKCYEVLTGFKWIADVIRRKEGVENFVVGLEESFGYMIGDFVRDKDSVTACLVLAEMAVSANNEGKTLFDKLIDIYLEYNLYYEELVNVQKPGISGMNEIKQMMDNFRNNTPKYIGCHKVNAVHDLLSLKSVNYLHKTESKIDLPKSNVLQFELSDKIKISVRPSGTEPKIKFYISVKSPLVVREDYERHLLNLKAKVSKIKESLNL